MPSRLPPMVPGVPLKYSLASAPISRNSFVISRSSSIERLLQAEEVAPCQALLQRLTQEVGRVQRRHSADFAPARMERKPAAARLENAIVDAEQGLHGGLTQADEHVRVGELYLPQREGQANRRLL